MTKITVLINDNYQGTPNPLLYDVEVNDPTNAGEVLAAVTKERQADLGGDEELDLELLIAFEGPAKVAADWRE